MRNRATATAAITVTALLALAGCAGTTTRGAPGATSGAGTSASAQAADMNEADMQFTMMMLPHHEQAIEMSDIVLAKVGIDERVITLAEQIKAAQGPEIEQLKSWLDDWGAGTPHMGGMHDMGDGMMSDADMQALDEASGAEASRLFLEQMIVHHKGAIDMARSEVANGQNAAVISLAEAVITSQTAEIAAMESVLETR